MALPRFINASNVLTGLQAGGAIAGTVGTIAVTKSITDDIKEFAPYILGSTVILAGLYLVAM